MNTVIKFLATGLGVGYGPKMPGTYGSLLAVPLVWVLRGLDPLPMISFCFVFGILSIWVADRAEQLFGEHDSPKIVIDEIAGMLFTFILIPINWATLLAGFFLFRFFDIVKVPPIQQSQRLKGGWGVVVDDILAGIFANITLQIGLTVWYAVQS